ncbi:phosphomannomutase [Massilia sp. R2A-15]|uniref:phosphomannomutase n=1 Tax=Massilia sp. R2A-15 TaxID=3064278 RepID=UPI0027348071|nr:phosphomannomutase [Massilia sp. R2A-15]WLI88035.1 phosphomannomutase [Massilia sp. R2A-15]
MKKINIADMMRSTGVAFGTSGARGLVAQMTPEVCYAYTAAFWQAVGTGKRAVIGHDLRPSSPAMAGACAAALADLGVEVLYAGALPTPALASFGRTLGAPVLVVTGSHIPFDRNGLKFYSASGEISKADEQAMLHAVLTVPDQVAPASLPAPDPRAQAAYLERYTGFFEPGSLRGMRVAVYEHSSAGRDVLRAILAALGAEVLALGRADTFVPIDTEAVGADDVARGRQWAAEHRFDAIVSTDGDADRPLIGDETGAWFRGDMVGVLCAQFLHADVVVTPVSSNTAVEKCGAFGQVLRTRIGSPYVIAGMEQAQAAQGGIVTGYEANGGFLLGSDISQGGKRLAALPTRDAVLPMLALLTMARQRGCRLSELARGLPARFTHSDRLQEFPTSASVALVAALQEDRDAMAAVMAPGAGAVTQVDTTDGLRVTFGSGDIVHLRPSGNAPELRCYAEAADAATAQRLCQECLARILARART